MAGKRTYGDPCGIARGLDLIGERWALLVIRELVLGPKRFTDLRAGLLQVSADVLAERLRDLELAGVVQRRTLPPPAASRIYELTAWGMELEPVVLALGRWGSRAPFPRGDAQLSTDAFLLALKTLFDPAPENSATATAVETRFELVIDGQPYDVRIAGQGLDIVAGPATDPAATIRSDPRTLTDVLWHGRALPDAQRSGAFTIEGDYEAARSFLMLFPAPVPVGAA